MPHVSICALYTSYTVTAYRRSKNQDVSAGAVKTIAFDVVFSPCYYFWYPTKVISHHSLLPDGEKPKQFYQTVGIFTGLGQVVRHIYLPLQGRICYNETYKLTFSLRWPLKKDLKRSFIRLSRSYKIPFSSNNNNNLFDCCCLPNY